MSDGFKFFEGTRAASSAAPQVSVRRSGQLVLTQGAAAMLGDGVTQVQIGFNTETRAVGIRPATEGAKGTYRLRVQAKSPSRLLDAKRLFAHHGVTVGKAHGLAVEDFGGGIVGFRLPGEAEGAEVVEVEKGAKAVNPRRKAPAG